MNEPYVCVHFIGFRDDRYNNAVRVWGKPDFIHRWLNTRAAREIGEGDIVVFAKGDEHQPVSPYVTPDIDERYL